MIQDQAGRTRSVTWEGPVRDRISGYFRPRQIWVLLGYDEDGIRVAQVFSRWRWLACVKAGLRQGKLRRN